MFLLEKKTSMNDVCHDLFINVFLHLLCRYSSLHLFHSNFPPLTFFEVVFCLILNFKGIIFNKCNQYIVLIFKDLYILTVKLSVNIFVLSISSLPLSNSVNTPGTYMLISFDREYNLALKDLYDV